MLRVIRHKASGKYAKIEDPDICNIGSLHNKPKDADIYNEETGPVSFENLIPFVEGADWSKCPEFKDMDEKDWHDHNELWEVVKVRINVEIVDSGNKSK